MESRDSALNGSVQCLVNMRCTFLITRSEDEKESDWI
jgi:hypothetical protein